MKKRASRELFNVLKSLVDCRVPDLNRRVERGQASAEKIRLLQSQISNAQQYMCNNRYDRAETMETVAEIAEYESEITQLRPVCADASFASTELEAANKFYTTYNILHRDGMLAQLRKEYADLENRADRLDDLIFNCEVNMNPFERSLAICEQAIKDMEEYREELDMIIKRMQDITREVHKLNGR